MEDLIKSIDCQEIERITGENQKTIKPWKKETKKISESASRLLRLYILGEASALLDTDWNGHYFRNNQLYIPEWRRGLTLHRLLLELDRVFLLRYLLHQLPLNSNVNCMSPLEDYFSGEAHNLYITKRA